MPLKTLEMAFVDELKDVHSAEKQLTKALPKMSKNAANEQLRKAFDEHLKQTEKQIERLEKVFQSIGRASGTKRCVAMEGIVQEGKELMEEEADPDVMDAMLIQSAQKVEHYEIATYGTLCTWAKLLGHDDALKLLKETLAEEKETDAKLTKLAEQVINTQAMQTG